MFRRVMPYTVATLFTIALAVGAIGWATHDAALMEAGTFGPLAFLPALTWVIARHAHRVGDDQLAAAHRAGYELALDQVARGLLEPDAGATPPHGRRYDLAATEVTANVRHLRAVQPFIDKDRKAI